MRTVAFLLLVFTTASIRAQVDLRMDSLAQERLSAFHARLRAEPILDQPPAPPSEYKLVLTAHDNGYFTTVRWSDSTLTLFALMGPDVPTPLQDIEGVTWYGERYAVLVTDRPVGMLDRTRWFFERKPRSTATERPAEVNDAPRIGLRADPLADSLHQFRAAMEKESIKEFSPLAPEQYVLVWKEQRLGASVSCTRGDGSTLQDLLTPDGDMRPEIREPFGPWGITNYGNRYALVWVSPDTGLARYTAWYFERHR